MKGSCPGCCLSNRNLAEIKGSGSYDELARGNIQVGAASATAADRDGGR